MFGSKINGTSVIDQAIAKFAGIVEQIDTGIRANTERLDANDAKIAAIELDNIAMRQANDRGQRVAAKLRELIA